MEHGASWRYFQVSSAFLGWSVRLQICCSNTNSRSPRPDELLLFFFGGNSRKSEDDSMQFFMQLSRYDLDSDMKRIEQTNGWCHLLKLVFFCHLYILNLSSRSSSFFPGDFANWWIQKRHLLRWGQFFLRGGCCLGMGWILIFTAKVETETFSKAWYQHKEELQQGREQASDFMLPLHRTLSIFFSQFWTDLKQTWPPGHPANVGHWRAGEYFNGPGGMS